MTPEERVDVVTPEEIAQTIDRHLAELGVTFEELKSQAETGDFQSNRARLIWLAIEHLATPA